MFNVILRSTFQQGPSGSLPSELRFHGALLKQKGTEERLLRHMLLSGRMLSVTEQRLRILLLQCKAPIIKFAEKTVTKKSLVWSLIMAVLPEVEQSQKLDLLLCITGAKQKPDMVPDEITDHALKSMGDEEGRNQFEGLKNRIDRRIIDKRFQQSATRAVGDRKAREHFTPECIKQLRPPWKCTLVLDAPKSSFEAYYPNGRPSKSTSMKYDEATGGSESERSRLAALSFCVEYLWRNHSEKGRVSQASLRCMFLRFPITIGP